MLVLNGKYRSDRKSIRRVEHISEELRSRADVSDWIYLWGYPLEAIGRARKRHQRRRIKWVFRDLQISSL